jgi:DNA-binding NarL/FixJ family response regulator
MLKTLIVEDDPMFCQIVREILISKFPSMSVKRAGDAREAFQKFDTYRPDIIFMDIKLPDINGIELTKRMKALNPKVAVVILTNHDTPQYREAAFQSGADYFISKASTIENEIEAAVRSASSSPNQGL